jgi:hypothetical protein
MVAQQAPPATMLAEVRSVDEAEKTCLLYDEETGLEFPDVRFAPVINAQKAVVMVPKIGAWVLVARIENEDEWMLLSASEIEKVSVFCGESTIEIRGDKIVFNGGDFGGLAIVSKIEENLEALKDYVQDLTTAVENGLTNVGAGDAADGTRAATSFQIEMATKTIDFEDMENNKVMH